MVTNCLSKPNNKFTFQLPFTEALRGRSTIARGRERERQRERERKES